MQKKGFQDSVKLARTILYLPRFFGGYIRFRKDASEKVLGIFPVLYRGEGSSLNFEYRHQDIYVASKILEEACNRHINHLDIGSRTEGFITSLVAAGVKLTFTDINLPGHISLDKIDIDLQSLKANTLTEFKSVSCVLESEHIGLGKYGDSIQATGLLYAIEMLISSCSKDPNVDISFPVSNEPGVYFDSGRELDAREVLSFFDRLWHCRDDIISRLTLGDHNKG